MGIFGEQKLPRGALWLDCKLMTPSRIRFIADVSSGSARDRRLSDSPVSASQNAAGAAGSDQPGPSIPRINILPSTIHIDSHGRTLPESSQVTEMTEEPEIEALLLAQRARTPLAIAVAQDYLEPPFKVPRAFVVLGWFWLTDAWVRLHLIFHRCMQS